MSLSANHITVFRSHGFVPFGQWYGFVNSIKSSYMTQGNLYQSYIMNSWCHINYPLIMHFTNTLYSRLIFMGINNTL